jgi:ABC-type multidrug transport system fused ATPase/permease subunit
VTAAAVPYLENARRHALSRATEARLSERISRLRLATFLVGAGILVWSLWRGATPSPIAVSALFFVVFGIAVGWHARVEERIARHDAMRLVNLRALARGARDWSQLPETGMPSEIEAAVADHPFALDLDVFGRASLFQWLGPASTAGGRLQLARWLIEPASPHEVRERQQAVGRLAVEDDWRLEMAAHGVLAGAARQPDIDRFLAWAEGEDPFGRRAFALRAAVLLIVVTMWVAIALDATGVTTVALWPIPLVVGIVLSFATGEKVQAILDRAGGGQYALGRYAAMFEHAVRAPIDAPRLAALRERLSSHGATAPGCMRRLNRILGFGELRRGAAILHFPIQALTLWDFHVIFALDRWRRATGPRVRGWLAALGELDALALVASARRDNPGWAVPEITETPAIEADGIGHPLLPDDRRVANDLTIGPPGTLVLITGSNMSGKSTLLRSIGLNIVLAQAGASVCARRMTLPACDLQTSLRVQDSLERGLSYFMAALARLKGVVDAAEHEREGRVLVYLLDEILQGTNSAERSIAVRAVARHLLDAGAIGAMTTHDLAVAGEEPLASSAQLLHFTETLDPDGTMRFDYTLRPGLATSRNALRLMQLIGIDL